MPDRLVLIVLPQQLDRQLELRTVRLDDVFHAIGLWRRRPAGDFARVFVHPLDFKQGVGSVEHWNVSLVAFLPPFRNHINS